MAAVILLSSMISPALWQQPRIGITDTVAPIISAVGQPFRFIGDAIGGMTGITQLRAENDRLKAENARLKEWYQTALLLKAENQSLKDLLNVIPEPEQSYISTRVIGDSGSSYVRSVLLEAGRQNGVTEGQAVLGSQGMLGRVIEVGNRASRVLLLNDINSKIPVIIEGTNQKAILSGTNEDYLALDHLPPDTLVEVGARVVTSSYGGVFPQGLPIGRVVKTGDGQIMVKPFTDPVNASYVQVIEKPDDPNVRQSVDILKTQPAQTAIPLRAPALAR
jgi:rod shape-determining protein MreC